MRIAHLGRQVLYALIAFAGVAHAAVTDLSPVPLNTYSAATSTDVKPNVFFILDDSGSMDWDFMPDWACASYSTTNSSCNSTGQDPASARSEFLFRNAAYNGSYYNPAVRYVTPLAVNADGTINTATYPSQTGTSTATGGDSNATSSSPNWKAVKDDAYGVQSTSSSDLQTDPAKPPYFFTMIAKEYCTLPNLKTCVSATAPSDTYKYPAVIRWCNGSNLSTCRATFSSSYNWVRAPSPRTATITVSAGNLNISDISVGGSRILPRTLPTSSSVTFSGTSTSNPASVTNITVNGRIILSAATQSSGNANTVASRVAANINQCTAQMVGACQATGYYAVVSGAVVTIYDMASNVLYAPVFSKTGSLSISPSTTGPTFARPSTSTGIAQAIADGINACTLTLVGNCTTVGYTATSSSNIVTITAPIATSATPSVTPSASISVTAFSLPNSAIPGENIRTTLTPSVDSYPYPGSTTKAPGRTDCAGTTCTYKEEMTNYANWWTYYRTRMQMMKTAATNAFLTMDSAEDIAANVSRFRLGYMSINNNTQADFLNLDEFKTSQKYNWYLKLVSANPSNSTPLRKALSTAGKYYAGVLDGTTLNGSAVVDPLQYSCQQNYTILSTDGFWNESSGYTKLDGSTNVGNQDVGLQRPYYDGGSAQLQTRTSTLQQRTGALQIRTFSGGRRGSWSNWNNANSCTPVSGSAECRYNWSTWTNASSCTVSQNTASDSVWNISNGTDCQYASWTSWANASSCTVASQSVAPNYTVGLARDCQTISSSGGSTNSLADVAAYYYNTDLRNSSASAPDATGTCTGPTIAPSTTPNDLCANNVPTNGRDVATTQHMTTFTLGLGSQGQMIYAPIDGKDYWNDTSGDFFDVLKGNTADSSSGICSWQSSGACNWPVPSSNSNANIDDLWHAAINGHGSYFSASDPASLSSSLTNTLSTIVNTPRPGTAAAAASSNPNVSASDNYVFSSSYKSVDWYGELIRQQITTSGTLTAQNWSARKLLDCATTSWAANASYIVGDAYRNSGVCYYVTTAYTSGNAFNQNVDGTNTVVVNNDETAETKTAATPLTSRNIYTNNAGRLVSFQWTDPANPPSNPNSLSDAQKAYFTRPAITYVAPPSGQTSYVGLSQFCSSGGNCLSTTQQAAAEGAALVNYLRGDRTNEGTYFRKRVHVLGDIVSSEARYVQTPMFNYTDTNYGAYKTAKASRAGRVYVGSNDGMLHAFDAATGQEAWAYIPSFVLPQLYKLADKQYSTNHQYFVDGTPETGDICPNAPGSTCTAAQWKTILVGGLNLGGKGYYALDITDPAAPQLLWEFTDANMGYTYGNPTITKLEDGTWVVLISSGYNNADGAGRLYVLNANSGTLIRTINTGVGSAASPSGLSRISAHVLQPLTNNTSRAAYGGDMFGNLWRFDINGDIGASGYDAQLLVTVKGPNNETQPITVTPVQATIGGKPVIFAGTGRFLGVSDVSDTSTESFYAVKDNLDTVTFGNPRLSSSNFVQQTLSVGTCPANAPTTLCQPSQEVRLSTNNAVDWSTKNGWYLDFVTGGERSSTDPSLALGTLLFTTITPQASSGSACGPTTGTAASFIYALNYMTGAPVNGALGVSGISLGSGLVTRPVMIEQADGTVRALIRTPAASNAGNGTDDGSTIVTTPPVNPLGGGATRRVSWRVLSN